jgi:hypothetical protein
MTFGTLVLFAALLEPVDSSNTAGAPLATERPADPPIDSDSKREMPDYDGRDATTTTGDALLWVPRVVLSPLYFVSEYAVRRPLGWIVTRAEEARLPRKLEYVFTFGRPEHDIGLVPTALVDFGLRGSVGVYFFWDDFLLEGNDLRARVATGGADWLLFSLADRVELSQRQEIALRAEYAARPDHSFHGFGPESSSVEAWYFERRVETGLSHTAKLWRSSMLRTHLTLRVSAFDASAPSTEGSSVSQAIAQGRYSEPPGLSDGYGVALSGLQATVDTREPIPTRPAPASDWVVPPGTGARVQVRAELGTDLRGPHPVPATVSTRYHWLKYGTTLAGFVELPREQRVFGTALIADFADPLLEDGEIPFTEQVSLGGRRPMRGFLEGRLIDRSSVVALTEYRWPVWINVDGVVHYGVGNVFGPRLEGFDASLLRQSFGIGLRETSSRDHTFEALLAFGTRTFGDGGEVENVRFTIGANTGF